MTSRNILSNAESTRLTSDLPHSDPQPASDQTCETQPDAESENKLILQKTKSEKIQKIKRASFTAVTTPDVISFQALEQRIKQICEKSNPFDQYFIKNIDELVDCVAKALQPSFSSQLMHSSIGKTLLRLKRSLEIAPQKDFVLSAIAQINQLINQIKNAVLTFFFCKNQAENLGAPDRSSQKSLLKAIIDMDLNCRCEDGQAGKAEKRPQPAKLSSVSEKRKKSESQPAERENFKVESSVRQRVIKKIGKIVLQAAQGKISKEHCEELTLELHSRLKRECKSLTEYKLKVIHLIKMRKGVAELLGSWQGFESVDDLCLLAEQLVTL